MGVHAARCFVEEAEEAEVSVSDESTKWLDDLHMVRERVDGRAYALQDLAETFARIGNDKIAKELALSVQVLKECSGTINRTTGVLCAMIIRQSNEASDNMFKAALAGAELASRKEK